MCLGLPGQVIEWIDQDPIMASATIQFGSIKTTCQMACVPEARVGDFVIVHAGVALTVIDQLAAETLLKSLEQLENFHVDQSLRSNREEDEIPG